MKDLLQKLLQRAHRDERGAIVLLVLAAFLIVFMTGLILYDTGKSARDKMDVQIAADTAAYSQAAVKSRTMNMIAYANVAKRTFYAFDTMYTAAYLGMAAATAEYASICAAGLVIGALRECAKAIQGGLYFASETAELMATNYGTLGSGGLGIRYASLEVDQLDTYQEYMNAIGPWWGWSENLTRGIRNGATLTSSWPPPPGNLAALNSLWVTISQFIDSVFSTSYYQFYPSLGKKDSLPIEKNEDIWSHVTLCASTAVSTEYLWMWGEHYVRSSGFARDELAILSGIIATPLGCLAASMLLGDNVLPYEVKSFSYSGVGSANTSDDWLEATSNVTISYKMDQKRLNSDRESYNYMSREAQKGLRAEGGGGYFAVTRSEVVYSGGFLSSAAGAIQGAAEVAGPLSSVIGGLRDIFDQPNMWAARWTARMRPMELPGESAPNFNGMFKDMLPYMLLASPIAFASSGTSSFSLSGARGFGQTALLDLIFLEIASAGMSESDGMRGFVK